MPNQTTAKIQSPVTECPGHKTERHPPGKSILAIWLPCWPIQRLVAAASVPRRASVILYRNHSQRGQIVTAVSPLARLCGARIGMPLSEAQSLVGRTAAKVARTGGANRNSGEFRTELPAVCHVLQHDPDADARQLEQLAIGCQQFSPLVGLASGPAGSSASGPAGSSASGPADSVSSGDDAAAILWLDVGSVLHLFGGANGLQTAIAKHFQTAGYTIRQALAPTPGMAWGLARFDGQPGEGFVPTDSFIAFDQLPVAALRLSPLTLENLQHLGVERIGQLRQLPRKGLRSRFGGELIRRLDQADGVIEEVIPAIHPPADFCAEQVLDYPVADRETISVILARLARGLCDRLRSDQRGGLVWRCRLAGPGQRPLDLTVRLFQPTATLEHLMPLVEMQLDDLFSPSAGRGRKKRRRPQLESGVQDISVSVGNCVLLAERQRQLFDEKPRLDRLALSQLINRLASRLGPAQVVRPHLGRGGAQAEDAAWFEPLVGGAPRSRASGRARAPAISPLQRPLVLLPRPRPLEAVSLDGRPETDINLPTLLVLDDQRLPVVRRWGPERIETAWWRGPVVRRDYWRIETGDHRWLWVFRDLQTRKWYLHGKF